jgi:peptidoglycan/xylan/chitin deacetylase (PgdA/CDA1 family)
VLTFDDAYRNFGDVVWPLLRDAELPAVLYVPVGFLDRTAPSPIHGAELPPLDWSELRSLADEGLDVGSHTLTHANLAQASAAVVEREVKESRLVLEERVGRPIATFCYPQAKWNARVAEVVGRHYSFGVVGGGRRARPGVTHRTLIPRFPVRRDIARFDRMVQARLWMSEAVADQVRQFRR